MENTFTREITFLSRSFNSETQSNQNTDGSDHYTKSKKTATFHELSRTDKSQQKLCFEIVGIYSSFGGKNEEGESVFNINGEALHDMTLKCIKTLLILNENFNATDKVEFLQDSGALIEFGMWMMGEKITPFFSQLMTTSS